MCSFNWYIHTYSVHTFIPRPQGAFQWYYNWYYTESLFNILTMDLPWFSGNKNKHRPLWFGISGYATEWKCDAVVLHFCLLRQINDWNSFNMRDKQRCRQTISKGEENLRFISVAQLCNFITHEHKLYKFAYFVPLNHGKSFVRILKRDSV